MEQLVSLLLLALPLPWRQKENRQVFQNSVLFHS
jgi:hypothetical protein